MAKKKRGRPKKVSAKKTSVKLDKSDNPNIIKNDSIESELVVYSKTEIQVIGQELTKDIVLSEVNNILNEIIEAPELQKPILKEKIRELLTVYNEKNLKNAFDILNIKNLNDIYSQDKSIKLTKDYKGFVYYFWNPKNMNFRIIGLHQVNPLFEIIDTKELFFLDKPCMSTLGKPIFWIIKGVPISQNIHFTDDYKEMADNFTALGYNAAQFRAMVDAPLFIRIFGKQHLPLRTLILIIAFMVIEFLVLHIIYSGFFSLGAG